MKSRRVQLCRGFILLSILGAANFHSAQECEPSRWGADDEIGAANHVTPEQVLMAVGADTWGVEVIPPVEGDRPFYGHVEFLKKKGIYILETMNTGRLAKEGVREFMFVLGQARIKGTVQMIINPVAMW